MEFWSGLLTSGAPQQRVYISKQVTHYSNFIILKACNYKQGTYEFSLHIFLQVYFLCVYVFQAFVNICIFYRLYYFAGLRKTKTLFVHFCYPWYIECCLALDGTQEINIFLLSEGIHIYSYYCSFIYQENLPRLIKPSLSQSGSAENTRMVCNNPTPLPSLSWTDSFG